MKAMIAPLGLCMGGICYSTTQLIKTHKHINNVFFLKPDHDFKKWKVLKRECVFGGDYSVDYSV